MSLVDQNATQIRRFIYQSRLVVSQKCKLVQCSSFLKAFDSVG